MEGRTFWGERLAIFIFSISYLAHYNGAFETTTTTTTNSMRFLLLAQEDDGARWFALCNHKRKENEPRIM
jgi:hypothetical protein